MATSWVLAFAHSVTLIVQKRLSSSDAAVNRQPRGAPLSFIVFLGTWEAVAAELMARIKKVVPILAVPLVARALVAQPDTNRAALVGAVSLMLDDLRSRNMPLPRREIGAMVDDALSRFALRKVVVTSGQHVVVPTEQAEIIAYYADTISHHFDT